MDQNRTVDTLGDEALAREIEAALAVDPSPEYLARVRTRIAREGQSGSWRLPWTLVGAGGFAVAVLVAVVVMRLEREPARTVQPAPTVTTPLGESAPTDAPVVIVSPPAPTAPVIRSAGVSRARRPVPTTTEPEILISPGDAAALRVLMISVRQGHLDPTVLEALQAPAAPLKPLGEITIQPIVIKELAPLARLEGERQ